MDNLKVIIWGLGAMGSGMARTILEKKGLEIVGAIESMPEKCGKDVGEVVGFDNKIGVLVSSDADEVLKKKADNYCRRDGMPRLQ